MYSLDSSLRTICGKSLFKKFIKKKKLLQQLCVCLFLLWFSVYMCSHSHSFPWYCVAQSWDLEYLTEKMRWISFQEFSRPPKSSVESTLATTDTTEGESAELIKVTSVRSLIYQAWYSWFISVLHYLEEKEKGSVLNHQGVLHGVKSWGMKLSGVSKIYSCKLAVGL